MNQEIVLDGEHHAQTFAVLRRLNVELGPKDAELLCLAVKASLDAHFVTIKLRIPFRRTHKELRDLWQLCNRSDPVARRIKTKAHSLSEHALMVLGRKATVLFPKLLGIEFTPANFRAWIAKAKKAELVWVLRVCIAERVFVLEGRERGDQAQSQPHLEPRIMGYTRRGQKKGGSHAAETPAKKIAAKELRPDPMNIHTPPVGYQGNIGVDSLIMFLAVDWAIATGEHPLASQGSQEIFIAFIDMVFNWLEKPNPKKMLAAYIAALKAPEIRLEFATMEKN